MGEVLFRILFFNIFDAADFRFIRKLALINKEYAARVKAKYNIRYRTSITNEYKIKIPEFVGTAIVHGYCRIYCNGTLRASIPYEYGAAKGYFKEWHWSGRVLSVGRLTGWKPAGVVSDTKLLYSFADSYNFPGLYANNPQLHKGITGTVIIKNFTGEVVCVAQYVKGRKHGLETSMFKVRSDEYRQVGQYIKGKKRGLFEYYINDKLEYVLTF